MDSKTQDLIKSTGAGGFGVVVVVLLWQIQASMADQRAELSRIISEIDKRVAVLEYQQQSEALTHVRKFAN